jgi:hypothetical protein
MLTECGGISFAPQQGTLWWGYLPVSDETSFLEKYDEVITAITDCPTISGFCYTQLTDTGQEVNGLLRADRSHKLDPQRVREITRRPSRALPGEVLDNVQTVSEVTSFQQGGS